MQFKKNKKDDEIGPSTVTLSPFAEFTLSEANGLSRWAERCFAAAQHDSVGGPYGFLDQCVTLHYRE
jgi:hypothetical protein